MAQPLGSAFWRLYAASAVSNLADGVTRVVLPLLAATLTRDPVLVAGQTSLAFLPWLLVALPGDAGGHGADRDGVARRPLRGGLRRRGRWSSR